MKEKYSEKMICVAIGVTLKGLVEKEANKTYSNPSATIRRILSEYFEKVNSQKEG